MQNLGAGKRDDQMEDESRAVIPGFTAEQSWAMNVVAERAAQKAIAEFCQGSCPLSCERMDQVHTVVFGRTEKGIVGLDQRMATTERTMASVRRFGWIVLGAAVSSVVAAVIGLIITLSGVGG